MHPVRAAAHGTEKLHAHLARRHAAGHRRHRLRPPDLALGRRRNAARPVARLDDARRRRSAGQQPQSHQGQEKYGRRTDRLAVLQEGQRPRPLQRTRAYDARRLRAGSPPLRRRAGLPFHDPEKDGILVENEQVAYTFPGDYTAYAPYVGHKRLLDSKGSSAIRSRTPTPVSR